MKQLVEYTHCLKGGGILRISGIPRIDGGIIVLIVEYIPAVVLIAA